jgi:hypothetical protein
MEKGNKIYNYCPAIMNMFGTIRFIYYHYAGIVMAVHLVCNEGVNREE